MLIPICGERLPVKLECSVVKARGLPIMNKSINSTDGFVEVRFADNTEKTEVVTSLNPVWESDIFSFDTDEKELTTEFLEFRVMDYDTYSANDAIGRVHLDCNILVERMRRQEMRHLEEQFTMPIYDTINGLRGELIFQVSIHLLIQYDYTNYVQMLSGSQIPSAFILSETVGLLCDVKTVKDPDYEWLDRIRSPRSTNEARQSCIRETMRTAAISVANKADKYGCNLILGYHEHIDVEGSSSNYLTVRVYGTAIKITVPNAPTSLYEVPHIPLLSIGWVPHAKQAGFGSLISAKSIKILDEDEDSESQRKSWWTELRTELHQQAQSLGCDLVIGYAEHVAIHDGIMLLGCSGTAVLTGQSKPKFFLAGARGSSAESESSLANQNKQKKQPAVQRSRGDTVIFKSDCEFFHTSMVEGKTSFSVKTQKCYVCKQGDVADFIISTATPPSNNCYQGARNFIQVSVTKKINSDPEDTEEYAHELSNTLPFADNELFDCLLGEIKHVNAAANALFDTRFNYALSDDLLVCVITGIAVRLTCIGKDEASSPLLSNVLMFSALQRTNDARRFSWGTVKEAMRFKQVNIPSILLKILPIKSPVAETVEEANSSKGRLRLNTLVGRLKKRQHEKEYMSHVISERHLSISIGVIESTTGGNANNIAGIHVSPNISALLMNRETAETCPVIARWSDVFVKEDLSNSVKESHSLDSFVLSTFEELLSQIRAIASLSGHSSVSHLRVDSPQFTISKEHAHIIIFMSCDIYSVDF